MQAVSSLSGASAISTVTEKSGTQPPVFDQPILPPQILQSLLQVQDLHALQTHCQACKVTSDITRYPLYPIEAGQPWAVELYDISQAISAQYDKIQTKLLCIVEGTATVQVDAQEKTLQPGQLVRIAPESTYSLTPSHSGCRFLSLSMPATIEDVFTDRVQATPAAQYEHNENQTRVFIEDPVFQEAGTCQLTDLNKEYFQQICQSGPNTAHDLIAGETVGKRYNVSIHNIVRAKKHHHEKGTEIRIVLGGNLEVDLEKTEHSVRAGQICRFSPLAAHGFTSQDPSSHTRLLAINIPAWNPDDYFPDE